MKHFAPIVCALLLAGCATPKDRAPRWHEADFIDKTFSLDDPRRVDDITFCRDHHAAPVTFGIRNSWLCAPLMSWRLNGNRLEVYDYDKTLYESFTLVAKDERRVTVTNREGKLVTYRIK